MTATLSSASLLADVDRFWLNAVFAWEGPNVFVRRRQVRSTEVFKPVSTYYNNAKNIAIPGRGPLCPTLTRISFALWQLFCLGRAPGQSFQCLWKVDPGNSMIVRDKNNKVEYLG